MMCTVRPCQTTTMLSQCHCIRNGSSLSDVQWEGFDDSWTRTQPLSSQARILAKGVERRIDPADGQARTLCKHGPGYVEKRNIYCFKNMLIYINMYIHCIYIYVTILFVGISFYAAIGQIGTHTITLGSHTYVYIFDIYIYTCIHT